MHALARLSGCVRALYLMHVCAVHIVSLHASLRLTPVFAFKSAVRVMSKGSGSKYVVRYDNGEFRHNAFIVVRLCPAKRALACDCALTLQNPRTLTFSRSICFGCAGETESVLAEHLSPYEVPMDFGKEVIPLQVSLPVVRSCTVCKFMKKSHMCVSEFLCSKSVILEEECAQ